MYQDQNVHFRQHKIGHDGNPLGETKPVEGAEPASLDGIEVCEIKLADGNVGVFPAHDMVPDRGVTFAQLYAGRYQQFKNGETAPLTDAEKIEQLEAQVRAKDALLEKHGVKEEGETGEPLISADGLDPADGLLQPVKEPVAKEPA